MSSGKGLSVRFRCQVLLSTEIYIADDHQIIESFKGDKE